MKKGKKGGLISRGLRGVAPPLYMVKMYKLRLLVYCSLCHRPLVRGTL